MHFLVMNPCSHDFLLMLLCMYTNYSGSKFTVAYLMSAWILDCELSTCFHIKAYVKIHSSVQNECTLIAHMWFLI